IEVVDTIDACRGCFGHKRGDVASLETKEGKIFVLADDPSYVTGGEPKYPQELFSAVDLLSLQFLVSMVFFRRISPNRFLSSILLVMVIIVTVVIVMVIWVVIFVDVIVGVVIVVVIIGERKRKWARGNGESCTLSSPRHRALALLLLYRLYVCAYRDSRILELPTPASHPSSRSLSSAPDQLTRSMLSRDTSGRLRMTTVCTHILRIDYPQST
ncbi:hypothetical protein Tco_1262490, partial [Tanacetum coccineum]